MKINQVTMTVSDYCSAYSRREVTIDRRYQRSHEVWPDSARSYLIETLLKEFPIPKLAIHQVTDLKSRKTVKKVVDGQQRSMAILDFYNDDFRLSRRLELAGAAGKTYSELTDELKEAFLAYMLVFDQFESAAEEDVREYFRRINSFTAPLTAEEQRHARFQGPMKWFVHGLARDYSDVFVNLGVLAERKTIRMADAKLLAEMVHALVNGIETTSKTKLDKLYHDNDRGDAVKNEDAMREGIDEATDIILGMTHLHTTALMKMNIFYSLVLAIIRVRRAWPSMTNVVAEPKKPAKVVKAAEENLLTLAEALEEPEDFPDYKDFTDAAAERTNVKSQRETRVRWISKALTDPSF
jgi:hypothetical protein